MRSFITNPFSLAGIILVLMVITLLLVNPPDAEMVFNVGGFTYALFILVNSFAGVLCPGRLKYFWLSMLSSVLYILSAAVICMVVIDMEEKRGSSEGAMIFMIALYHPLLFAVVQAANWFYRKWIVKN